MKTYYQTTVYTHPDLVKEQIDAGTIIIPDDVLPHEVILNVEDTLLEFFETMYPALPPEKLVIKSIRLIDIQTLHDLVDEASKSVLNKKNIFIFDIASSPKDLHKGGASEG